MEQHLKLVEWFNAVDWIRAGSRILVILVVSGLLVTLARRVISAVAKITAEHAHDVEARKRAMTLSNVLRKLATIFIVLIATLSVLSTLGISILPFLATAGVAGIAIAFGAQSLVKDFFRGFFLLAENQIRQGDVVEIAGKTGVVEDLTLRYVQLRDYDGNVHFVPNGEISVVTSSSRGYSYAVFDVTVAISQDIAPVIDVMQEVGAQLRANSVFKDKILEDLDIAGIETWTAAGITLRARFKVAALEQGSVKREYLLRLKRAFDDRNIEQPKTTMMLVRSPATAADKAGGAAPPGPSVAAPR